MSVVRILFLGTPEFAVPSLGALIEDEHFEVVAAVSQPDRPAGRKRKMTPSPVKVFAASKGLQVISPETVKSQDVLDEIKSFGADAAVVVAFGQILPQSFLDLFPLGVVNVHSSLLPRWRGAAPMQRALMNGDTKSGVSLQKVVLKLDAGDVIGVREINLDEQINAIELHDELKGMACDLLKVDFMDYLRGNLAGAPQDESQVTHAPKIEKSEAVIDWTQSAEKIHNQVRGLAMGPQPWTILNGKKVKLHRTSVEKGITGDGPGDVLQAADGDLVIACGQEALRIHEIQPESKGKMDAASFLRGYKLA